MAVYLKTVELPVLLFNVSCVADEAARAAGRKSDLYGSLFSYEQFVPAGYCCFWKKGYATGADDGVYVVGTPAQRDQQRNYRPDMDMGQLAKHG